MIEGFAHPAVFALSALAIPILLLYMLKPRRPRHVIPSTFLWRKAMENVASSRPWQRLRFSILLILQLLALAILISAFANPFDKSRGIAGKHLVLIVDSSGSMLAKQEGGTRMDAAVSEARNLLSSFPVAGLVSVIEAGPLPRVVISTSRDRSAVRSALERIKATEGIPDFSEAFILAESLETAEFPASIVLISDGGLSREERNLMPPGTLFQGVGTSGSGDLGLSMHVGEGAAGFESIVRIANAGTRDRSIETLLEVDGVPLRSANIRVAAGASSERGLEIGNRSGRLTASFTSNDLLAENNRAFAVLERARPSRILLVTEGNIFLEALLSQLPQARLDVKSEPSDGRGYDLVVYDRVAVPNEVLAPALFVSTSNSPTGVQILGDLQSPRLSFIASSEPLLQNVDLSELAIAKAQMVKIERSHTLIGADESPLIATWSDGALRRVWIGFDLHESNLALQVAFPVLGDHLLGWLTGSRKANGYAGEPIDIPPVAGADRVLIETPAGNKLEVFPGEAFADSGESGFYSIQYFRGEQELANHTAAVSFPPREQDLRPREVTAPRPEGRPGFVADARRSIATTFIMACLLLLLLEWWWAHGRPIPKTT